MNEGGPGTPVVFVDNFPAATGKARFVSADIAPTPNTRTR